jgi:hypothetical protein
MFRPKYLRPVRGRARIAYDRWAADRRPEPRWIIPQILREMAVVE